ncbi:MAG: hypothetical protein U1D67_02935 [Dehalococcoidia bacterium]|nr:hypothetical protein [Dehalococcoidia bacterium]MDZ4246054.1 hypothetical protein [Dehalococcoidia bacterium]
MTIRSLRPADLTSVLIHKNPFSNYVRTKDCLEWDSSSGYFLLQLVRQWIFFRKQNYCWVWIEKNTVEGIISIRQRRGKSAWEVNMLLLSPDNERAGLYLLDSLGLVSSKLNIPRLFLRLPLDSPIMEFARKTGFHHYAQERLYGYTGTKAGGWLADSAGGLNIQRQHAKSDFTMFQVYSRAIPASVREMEGLTLDEWTASRERVRGQRVHLCEKEGTVVAWFSCAATSKYALLEEVDALQDERHIEWIVSSGFSCLPRRERTFFLVFNFQDRLCAFLENNGFNPLTEFSVLAREQRVRVKQPNMVPVRL